MASNFSIVNELSEIRLNYNPQVPIEYSCQNSSPIDLIPGTINDIDTSLSSFTIQLPSAQTLPGIWYSIWKKYNSINPSSNGITLITEGDERLIGNVINSDNPDVIIVNDTKISTHSTDPAQITILSDGENWRISNGLAVGWNVDVVPPPPPPPPPSEVYRPIYIDSGYDYNDITNTIREVADIGYTVVVLAFLVPNGNSFTVFDAALSWMQLTNQQRTDVLNYCHAKTPKCNIVVSYGGAAEVTSPFAGDPFTIATNVSNFVNTYTLDGVDYDLEGIAPGFTHPGYMGGSQALYPWFNTLQTTTRSLIGPSKLISHAPQTPYLVQPGQSSPFTDVNKLGGYVKVYTDNPSCMNYMFIQFYNQGDNNYNTYNSTFVTANPDFPFTAVQQFSNNNTTVPYNVLVYGNLCQQSDGSTGYVPPATINGWLKQAQSISFPSNAGIWQYHSESSGSPSPQSWYQQTFAGL